MITLVAIGYRAPDRSDMVASVVGSSTPANDSSVNEVVATNVAATVASRANLPIATNIENLSVSLTAKSELSQTDDIAVAKPQIVQPQASRQAVINHKVVAGETVQEVARSYNISPDTIKWANDLDSDALNENTSLKILPVDGVLYTARSGDTIESIAKKYSANQHRLVAFNNLEIDGVSSGLQLIIPAGELPENERPGFVAPSVSQGMTGIGNTTNTSTNIRSNFMSGSVGNRYAIGYCTWYAYERRAALGRPVGSFWGNANTWAAAAAGSGYSVNNTPSIGAVLQTAAGGGGYGHVAVVESIDAAGNVTISEMNYAGWNVVSSRVIPAGQASSYSYIH